MKRGALYWMTLMSVFWAKYFYLEAESRLLPFQGLLKTSTGRPVSDGTPVVQFKIYDAPIGGRAVWDGEVQKLTVNEGLVSTVLGSKATLSGVDFNRNLYLEVTIDANGDDQISEADPPLLPRQGILPAVYAAEAGFAREAMSARQSAQSRLLGGYDWTPLFGENDPSGVILPSKIGRSSLTGTNIADESLEPRHLSAGDWPFLRKSGAERLIFSAEYGQKIDLELPRYGVGTQKNAMYFRTDSSFVWFLGGSHSSEKWDSGGGRVLMTVDEGGAVGAHSYNAGSGSFFGQGIELRTGDGSPSYIDFSNSPNNTPEFDFDIRLILVDDDTLMIRGGDVVVEDGVVRARRFDASSDRDLKEEFAQVDPDQILNRVANLSIQSWCFKDEKPQVRHIGPTAQDFKAAFGLGNDDRHISTVDVDGVALVAIQGLYYKMRQRDQRILELEAALEAVTRKLDILSSELRRR